MQELIDQMDKVDMDSDKTYDLVLLDTCFFIYIFEHQKEHYLEELSRKKDVALTSFNAEELIHNSHRVDERVREGVRRFLKKNTTLFILNINVHPGNREQEKLFVRSIDPELLNEVPDPSDAVLMAAAIKTKSMILTKDKHHLFTTKLENYINKYKLKVYKDFHEIEL